MKLLCRIFGHVWGVRGTAFDWESPAHVRICTRRGCDAEQMVMSDFAKPGPVGRM